MEKKRIFAAIDISEEARGRVAAYIEALRHDFPDVPARWEKPEKLHITIKFVGSVTPEELRGFSRCVAVAASGMPAFSVTISGTGGFMKRSSRANVLWLGLESSGSIEKLAVEIDPAEAGRRFHPHLTIARLKEPRKARELVKQHLNATFEPMTFNANEITIYQSTLLPTGSEYKVVSRHAFAFRTN